MDRSRLSTLLSVVGAPNKDTFSSQDGRLHAGEVVLNPIAERHPTARFLVIVIVPHGPELSVPVPVEFVVAARLDVASGAGEVNPQLQGRVLVIAVLRSHPARSFRDFGE